MCFIPALDMDCLIYLREEVENRTINLAISTSKLTGRSIVAGIRKYLQHHQLQKVDPGHFSLACIYILLYHRASIFQRNYANCFSRYFQELPQHRKENPASMNTPPVLLDPMSALREILRHSTFFSDRRSIRFLCGCGFPSIAATCW